MIEEKRYRLGDASMTLRSMTKRGGATVLCWMNAKATDKKDAFMYSEDDVQRYISHAMISRSHGFVKDDTILTATPADSLAFVYAYRPPQFG